MQELLGLSHNQGSFFEQERGFFQQEREFFPQRFGLPPGLPRVCPEYVTPWRSRRGLPAARSGIRGRGKEGLNLLSREDDEQDRHLPLPHVRAYLRHHRRLRPDVVQ